MENKKTQKALNDELREKCLEQLIEMFVTDNEVLRTGSNEIALPTVDSEQNEKFITITVKVPTGSRDGEAYDGYALAEEYKAKLADKATKAKEKAEEKAKKIERDKKNREKLALSKSLYSNK